MTGTEDIHRIITFLLSVGEHRSGVDGDVDGDILDILTFYVRWSKRSECHVNHE
jgi:hypothetical protein